MPRSNTAAPGRRSPAIVLVLALAFLVGACTSTSSDSSKGSSDGEGGDIYSYAGGCYSLTDGESDGAVQIVDDGWTVGDGEGDAEPFVLQATALGRYLLYGTDGQMVAAQGSSDVDVTTDPGPLADWAVEAGDDGLRFTNLETELDLAVDDDQQLVQATSGDAANGRWTLTPASGCDSFPDIDPGAEGEPFVGDSPDSPVRGFIDAHTHVSAFSFLGGSLHCGRPWSPYGPAVALADCPDHTDGGVGEKTEGLFSAGSFDSTHQNDGWPTFEGWPAPGSLTHEGTYWRWIERAWRGGERLMVNDLVDNRALCELYPINDGTPCGDMENVRDQAADMVALQDYIDAQFGGPGKGFFRLVESPAEAREVINEGKLAVVLGVEVSEILDCGLQDGDPACDEADIDAGLDELQELGVQSAFPVHKFDNALGGTKYDGGTTGLLVNAGNRWVTGEWWDPEPCEPGAVPDNAPLSPSGTLDAFIEPIVEVFGEKIRPLIDDDLPTYEEAPLCNPRGLTDLGEYAINAMIDRHMMIETDHLSAKARADTLAILEERDYSGVITSHGWGDEESQQRLVELGGFVSPYGSGAPSYADSWREAKDMARDDLLFGIGYGTDTNGLGGQPGAHDPGPNGPVEYPYTTFDGGTTMEQQVSGSRTYDVNVDGVAHYGLFPDWVEDLRLIAGPEIVEDLSQGAEAYLQMWERTEAHEG